MRDAVIVEAVRTPIGKGKPNGSLAHVHPVELLAHTLRTLAKWSLTRAQMDAFAASSHRKAATAWDAGLFDAEVAPLEGVTRDESVRPGSTPEILAGLKPAYYDPGFAERFPQIEWNVTAGNASPINDGASAVLITSSETAARLGLRPLVRLHSFAVTGSDPLLMLTGVVPATQKVLRGA